MDEKRGGVIVRVGGALQFVPASVALALTPAPEIARVPGAPQALLGAALHDGDVVPVIGIGAAASDPQERRGTMLVCSYLGEKVGLLGAAIVSTGFFDADPAVADAVCVGGETARPLDLAALYARVQGEGWAGRWRA